MLDIYALSHRFFSRTCLIAVLALAGGLNISLRAQTNHSVTGFVRNASTGEAIPGATIYAVSHDRGTYSLSDGSFRLTVPSLPLQLRVSSLGYEPKTIADVNNTDAEIVVELTPTDITLGEVVVTAEPTAEEIVRRAIQRKTANRKRLKTFNGLLYSKLTFEIEGNVFGQIEDKDRIQIRESFSRVMRDNEEDITHIAIEQRRQTANVAPDNNLLAITNFFSFYEERFRISNAIITTPLADDALDSYEFTLKERRKLGGQTAWTLDFKPYSDLFPGFVGNMTIVSGTYDLIEVRARPSAGTAIRYITDLSFHQKFEEVADSIWTPTYLNTSGAGAINIISGIAEVGGRLTATSFYKDIEVNGALPDSIYQKEQIFSVSPQADSSTTEFWDRNSPARLSQREQSMYREVDSLVKEAKIAAGDPIEESEFRYDFAPTLVFNRVGGFVPGLDVNAAYDPFRLNLSGQYGFGSEDFYGAAALSARLASWDDGNLWAAGTAFASLSPHPDHDTYFSEGNTVLAALFSQDHFDYFERHGWDAGLTLRQDDFLLSTGFSRQRHFSIAKTQSSGLISASNSPATDGAFRINPAVNEGEYDVVRATATWGNYDVNVQVSTNLRPEISAQIEAHYAENTATGERFRVLDGGLRALVPTFSTGYNPMTLQVAVKGGIADNNTPTQYRFIMPTKLSALGRIDQFATGGPGFFGGTSYAAVFVRHNFSDLWWRVLGLPTYDGRGLDLSLFVNSGLYDQKSQAGIVPAYFGMNDRVHTEAGFGIGKIPIFISNVIFLGFDAGWTLSSPVGDDFGFTVTLTSPF